jgi:hypothetical protein
LLPVYAPLGESRHRSLAGPPITGNVANGVERIATFDGDFGRIKGIRRIELP